MRPNQSNQGFRITKFKKKVLYAGYKVIWRKNNSLSPEDFNVWIFMFTVHDYK